MGGRGANTRCVFLSICPSLDLPPLDLLSFVLEKDTSRRTPGVRVTEDGGMRGVRFSRPHPSLSFPAAQLLVNCDLFPAEFSVVATLKVSHADLKVRHIWVVDGPRSQGPAFDYYESLVTRLLPPPFRGTSTSSLWWRKMMKITER